MKNKVLIISLSIIFGIIASAYPHSIKRNIVDVRVISDNGTEFPKYLTLPGVSTQGSCYYLEAFKGKKYSIEVTNRSESRIGVVIAVDGRNIISGGKSFLYNNERMYIIGPHSTDTFEGWRTGMDRINRFYFTEKADSYAEKVFSDASAMGTIALAVYREKPQEPTHISPSLNSDSKARGAKEERYSRSHDREKDGEDAGTGFGITTYSLARVVTFIPEGTISQRIILKYEWRRDLCKRGIINCVTRNRFWPIDNGFAPIPNDFRD
jgi:hypothetical protein